MVLVHSLVECATVILDLLEEGMNAWLIIPAYHVCNEVGSMNIVLKTFVGKNRQNESEKEIKRFGVPDPFDLNIFGMITISR